MMVLRTLKIASILWVFIAGSACAGTVVLMADLEPSSEVPPTTSRGSGKVDATFDTITQQLKWTVSYGRLSGPATAAHFHGPARVGQNAGVQVAIGKDALKSPMTGSKALTDTQTTDLMAGRWYFNIHTQAHPDGEIRGQVRPVN